MVCEAACATPDTIQKDQRRRCSPAQGRGGVSGACPNVFSGALTPRRPIPRPTGPLPKKCRTAAVEVAWPRLQAVPCQPWRCCTHWTPLQIGLLGTCASNPRCGERPSAPGQGLNAAGRRHMGQALPCLLGAVAAGVVPVHGGPHLPCDGCMTRSSWPHACQLLSSCSCVHGVCEHEHQGHLL